MSASVFAAVLAAACMHAGWNALVKLRLEPLLTMALITASAGVIALPALAWLGPPPLAAWPWLLGSIVLHLGYYVALTEAYRQADMGQVYPVARGSAPLLTTLASLVVLGEPVAPLAAGGVAILCLGVGLMAFGSRSGRLGPRALAWAGLTALMICGYTLVDGLGARAAGDAHAYSAALFVVDGIPLAAFVLWRRGAGVLRQIRGVALPGLVGGLFSLGSYWIAIWAMTVAPIPLVAALRETSVLVAALISVTILKEPLLAGRAVAAVVILAGIAAMRLG
ncbi:EamA family transporter [Methylobacterium oryzihabitans]|uniref:EamA family transporter n=1 Tax=Methylobacterium oryzihabitans TaxID=2499852 RepID=A0A3S2W6K7_9HYPH|nr:EamA family transporter [Methylobacterium oryzihabitans]RVU14964.1 EamA family transporter [Methylobacterium oryzihabitans]